VVAEGDYPTAKNYVVKTHPPLLPLLFDRNFNPFTMKGTLLMALTIKQLDLYRFERLVAKLFTPSDEPMVCLIPSSDGDMKLAAFTKDAIITMSVSKSGFVDPFSISHATLKTLAVKKDVDLILTPNKDNVHVQRGQEQSWVPREKKVNTLPTPAKETATNSKHILEVLHLTSRCADPANLKTALNGICLRGATEQILGTNGIQLLVNEGFAFPWKEDVITPVSKIFGSKELNGIDTDEVLIGQINEMVYYAVGEVEIWLRAITGGTFPKVSDLLKPGPTSFYLDVHPTDAAFVLEQIGKLPGSKDYESPIWISLGDKIQVRAYDHALQTGTALELSHSSWTEKDVKMSCNRLFLKNALQFGCLRIGIAPNDTAPAICTGTDRTFVFMPLNNKGEPEVEAAHMAVTTSESQPAVTPATKTSTKSVPKATAAVPAVPAKRRRKVAAGKDTTATKQGDNAVLLQSVEHVRQALRDSLVQVNDLIRTVKSHRRQERLLQNTMDSLRKLNIV
jgi:hypothetical protein